MRISKFCNSYHLVLNWASGDAREEHIAIKDNGDATNGNQNNARSKATKRTWPLDEVEDKLSNKFS